MTNLSTYYDDERGQIIYKITIDRSDILLTDGRAYKTLRELEAKTFHMHEKVFIIGKVLDAINNATHKPKEGTEPNDTPRPTELPEEVGAHVGGNTINAILRYLRENNKRIDAIQDGMIKLWDKIGKHRDGLDTLAGKIKGKAKRERIDYVRLSGKCVVQDTEHRIACKLNDLIDAWNEGAE